MITLSGSELSVTIARMGAEIQSIKRGDTEYMWSRDAEFWTSSAPIMFPICGGLKKGRYELDGVSYEMPKHGFAKKSLFEVEALSKTSLTLVLRDSEETRKFYPFSFAFRVKYELDGASLSVTYDVENTGKDTMYFSFGGHEAYACPEGIESYELVFPEKETLYAYALNGDLLTDYTKLIVNNSEHFPLDDRHFVLDALVFRDVKSRSVTLESKVSDRKLTVGFEGHDYLVFWHKYGAPYICIEPWCGVQDVAGSSFELSEKEGIRALSSGRRFVRTHTITVG